MIQSCTRCGARIPTDRMDACPHCLLTAEIPPAIVGGVLELQEEIGRGGMGTVYKAKHLRLGRTVAIKFLPEELAAQPEFQKRFEREAQSLGMLNHPNIVTVHDFGQEGDQRYIVMEFVDGAPLSEKIPLPIAQACDVAKQVCEALAYAHRQGIVHRDIKPENILITSEGRVKVTDFGIARIVRSDTPGWTVTASGQAFGTPHYIAPEAMHGAAPDPRMDIYSLGVVLYQMVTGRLPVGDFAAPPAPLDRIVRRALAPEPAKRYSTAEEMRRDLEAISKQPVASSGLPVDEISWMRAVALLQSVSTAVALYAFLVSVTPKILNPGDVLPLIMIGTETLPDGRILSRARFETWWTLAAVVTFIFAITAYGLLRRHWRRAGMEPVQPDRSVRDARWVFIWGVIACVVYISRRFLEEQGHRWITAYVPIIGGIIEVAMLYFFWMAILEAWRTSRPLRREPLIWLGFGLALIPPIIDLMHKLQTWKP